MKHIVLDVQDTRVHSYNVQGYCTVYIKDGKVYITLAQDRGSIPESDDTPQYKHDCSACLFLYRTMMSGQSYDVYFCASIPAFPTVIARYGDEGHMYLSGLGSSIEALADAEKYCRKIGLLK